VHSWHDVHISQRYCWHLCACGSGWQFVNLRLLCVATNDDLCTADDDDDGRVQSCWCGVSPGQRYNWSVHCYIGEPERLIQLCVYYRASVAVNKNVEHNRNDAQNDDNDDDISEHDSTELHAGQ
jgi:hypothetical protein